MSDQQQALDTQLANIQKKTGRTLAQLKARIAKLGAFETAPKKTYLSLRRNKQFAMVGPATKTQLEIGLNLKDTAPSERLVAVKQPAMCSAKVRLSEAKLAYAKACRTRATLLPISFTA